MGIDKAKMVKDIANTKFSLLSINTLMKIHAILLEEQCIDEIKQLTILNYFDNREAIIVSYSFCENNLVIHELFINEKGIAKPFFTNELQRRLIRRAVLAELARQEHSNVTYSLKEEVVYE